MAKLANFTLVFVALCLAFVAVIFGAYLEPGPDFGRTKYSIWAALILSAVATASFIANGGRRNAGLWPWWWTGAFLAYALHFHYAFDRMFDGSLTAVFQQQGTLVALLNLALSLLWLVDVVVLWRVKAERRWSCVLHATTMAFVLGSGFVAGAVFRDGAIRLLAVAAASVALLFLARRLLARAARNSSP